ncbi:MAG: glycosyltransferase family 4 protein [Oligoflexia bacterium]|nr:glycosyltransferase family 4 protein [Oligoflexia bacterium]
MRKKKILLLCSERPSRWWSCREITENLVTAYRSLGETFELRTHTFSAQLDGRLSFPELFGDELAEVFRACIPDEIVLAENSPDPLSILAPIRGGPAVELPPKTVLSIHVFGDFIFRSERWATLAGLLLNARRVKLICPSERHARLIRGFLADGGRQSKNPTVATVPLGVNCDFWKFDPKEREQCRKALGIAPDQRVLLYTGRISLQKNVTRLLTEFSSLVQNGASEARLWIAGPFDDRDGASMALFCPSGYSFQKFQTALRELPERVRGMIRYFEPRKSNSLRELYCAADAFVSLSLYSKEDFGMSPAEALATGLPVALTRWGGYSGFDVAGVSCGLIPVRLDEGGLRIESTAIQRALRTALGADGEGTQRTRRGLAFSREFSVHSATERLRAVLARDACEFPGFNGRFKYLAELRRVRKFDPDWTPSAGSFYEEVFKPYLE